MFNVAANDAKFWWYSGVKCNDNKSQLTNMSVGVMYRTTTKPKIFIFSLFPPVHRRSQQMGWAKAYRDHSIISIAFNEFKLVVGSSFFFLEKRNIKREWGTQKKNELRGMTNGITILVISFQNHCKTENIILRHCVKGHIIKPSPYRCYPFHFWLSACWLLFLFLFTIQLDALWMWV